MKAKINVFVLMILMIMKLPSFSQKIITTEYDWETKPVWDNKMDSIISKNKESYIYFRDYIIYDYYEGSDNLYYSLKTYHYIVYLADDNAIDLFNKVYIPFNNGIDIINVKARTFDRSGKITLFDKKNIKEAENLEDEGQFKLFVLDGIEKNNMVEVFYTLKKSADLYGLITLQNSVKTYNSLFQISTPKNIHYSMNEHNGKGHKSDSVSDLKRYVSYYYDSISPLKDEKFSNYNATKLKVDYKFKFNDLKNNSEYYTYDKAAQDLYVAIFQDRDKAKKSLLKIIKSLELNQLPIENKITKIENYIKNNYTLKELYDYDNHVQNVLKNKSGEEIGIVILFSLLFDAADINFELCLTTSRDKTYLDPDYMSWVFLDSYLFYFPETGKYLSPCSYEYRYPMIPFMIMDNNCMHIKEIEIGDIKSALQDFSKIPVLSADFSYHDIEANIKFGYNFSDVSLDIKHKMLGYPAIFIQPYYNFLDETKKIEFIKSFFKDIDEDIYVKDFKVSNSDPDISPLKDPLIIEANVNVPALIEKAGENYLFKVGMIIGEQSQLYNEEPRKLNVEIYYPHKLSRIIKVNIPEGYKVKGLESLNMEIKGKGMGFSSTCSIQGKTIVIEIHEFYENLFYSLEEFETFKNVINAAADFNKKTIVFEKEK